MQTLDPPWIPGDRQAVLHLSITVRTIRANGMTISQGFQVVRPSVKALVRHQPCVSPGRLQQSDRQERLDHQMIKGFPVTVHRCTTFGAFLCVSPRTPLLSVPSMHRS